VLCQPLERFPAEVEAIEIGIGCLESGDDSDGLRIVVEAAGIGERGVEGVFTGVAERRVTEIVGEAQSFGEILVEAKGPRHGAADLRDLQAMGQPHAVMVAIGRHEDLRLVSKASEGD
jgi:hypothetical protein